MEINFSVCSSTRTSQLPLVSPGLLPRVREGLSTAWAQSLPPFGSSFYEQRSDPKYVFAAVGGYRVTIYECVPSGAIEVLHVYVDPDPEEMHYTCAWSYEPETLQPILAVAGRNGVIRLVRYVFSKLPTTKWSAHLCSFIDLQSFLTENH